MPNLLDYYEYAKLATSAYVTLEGETPPYSEGKIAFQADDQGRLPGALADQTFTKNNDHPNPWVIPTSTDANGNPVTDAQGNPLTGYYGNDAEGFAATLFQRTDANGITEKVLAIRGTEPGFSVNGYLDLIKADLGEIGFLGLAMSQTVSMINHINRLRNGTDVDVAQFDVGVSVGVKPDTFSVLVNPAAPPQDQVYLTLVPDANNSTLKGLGLIQSGEKITVAGHSLGGHLAAMAARLFPDLISEAYTYNAPGFDTANDEVIMSEVA